MLEFYWREFPWPFVKTLNIVYSEVLSFLQKRLLLVGEDEAEDSGVSEFYCRGFPMLLLKL